MNGSTGGLLCLSLGYLSGIFLLENALLRNVRKQAKKKKKKEKKKSKGRRAWKIWLRRYRQLHSQGCQTPKDWSPMIAKLQLHVFEPETVLDIQNRRTIEWLSLSGFFRSFSKFFEESNLDSNVGEKKYR